MEVWRLAKLAR